MPKKGVSNNPAGKPKGASNRTTIEFKEAVNNLLNHATPNMIKWLDKVAEDSPEKALDTVAKLAEYVAPKLSRQDQHHHGQLQIVKRVDLTGKGDTPKNV